MNPRFALLSTLAAMVFCPLPRLHTQTTQAEAEARLIGKPLYLRVPVNGQELKFGPDGALQGHQDSVSFTEAGVDVKKVQLSGDHIKIEGERVAVKFGDKDVPSRVPLQISRLFGKKPVKIFIEIDNKGSQDFGSVLSTVFAEGLAEVAPTVPDYWRGFMSQFLLMPQSVREERLRATTLPQGGQVLHIAGSVKPPRVLSQIDPKFTDTARSQKFSGKVLLYLVVDEKGKPTCLRIVHPAGMGLDEHAIEAVRQYTFRPATRDGYPVAVDMNIEVNFQIF